MKEIKFLTPPLNEVVFGVIFNAPDFSSVHYGLYWQEILARFPKQIDRPASGGEGLGLYFSPMPPLRRVWFESEDEKALIQLQSDRFYYNCRKQNNNEDYPRFKTIYPKFLQEWRFFQDWWEKETRELIPVHYEITYINHIDKAFGWNSPADHKQVFTFAGGEWSDFLKPPESHIFAMQFSLSDELGSLSVNGSQGVSTLNNESLIVLDLTIRSFDTTNIDLDDWFNQAHDCINKSFLSLTQETIQKQWVLYEQ
ncbi:MAG: TIGR04255 family protein [Oculatellaceae cyanobacterium Prado106]|jgi:uncharacterized protein (TIGR04255 family)|nr:TIGR04255 family protein [Oculatellaceae cyanobacterium Prado106]